jgi:DNA-3-methyladenine glycosylase II
VKPDYWNRAKRELVRNDAVIGEIIRRFPRIHLTPRGDPFHTLARSIVGQQISVKAAQAVWNRLGGTLSAVTPAQVVRAGPQPMLACGLSRRKVEYLLDLAEHFRSGRIVPERWGAMHDEEVIAELIEVRGIGRWTAEMFLIFNLLRPDVLPLDDLGLQRAVRLAYRGGRKLSERGLLRIAAAWRPWRSVATWYLWRSLDPLPVEY